MCAKERGLSITLGSPTFAVPPDGGGAPTPPGPPMLDLCECRRASIGEGEVEGLGVESCLLWDNNASGGCCAAPAGWAVGCHMFEA
mmetsp:Transcript_110409/g.219466  ORF Transcript_110409/g.219466 Transcript_110409/m.219466 type:complete len:86 (+) Transcript_110409:327-584(+)